MSLLIAGPRGLPQVIVAMDGLFGSGKLCHDEPILGGINRLFLKRQTIKSAIDS